MALRTLNGKYELQQEIAETDRFTVYRAVEIATGAPVIVRILGENRCDDEAEVRQFTDEVRETARLDHPFLVPVLDLDTADGVPYVVGPLVEGTDLRTWLRGRTPVLAELIRILGALGEVLHAAAAAGVTERTIRLSNVLIGPDGEVRVLNFSRPRFRMVHREHGTTERGIQADLFFLGTLAFELFTGASPLLRRGGLQDAWDEQLRRGLRINHQALPPEQIEALVQIVERALTRTLARRYPTTEAMVADLRAVVAAVDGREAVARTRRRREQSLRTASAVVAAMDGALDVDGEDARAEVDAEELAAVAGGGGRSRAVAVAGRGRMSAVGAGTGPVARRPVGAPISGRPAGGSAGGRAVDGDKTAGGTSGTGRGWRETLAAWTGGGDADAGGIDGAPGAIRRFRVLVGGLSAKNAAGLWNRFTDEHSWVTSPGFLVGLGLGVPLLLILWW